MFVAKILIRFWRGSEARPLYKYVDGKMEEIRGETKEDVRKEIEPPGRAYYNLCDSDYIEADHVCEKIIFEKIEE